MIKRWYWLPIIVILLLGIIIQHNLFLSWDVSWRLIITKRFLHGGKYIQNFMDMNPPILLYTLAPALTISKVLHLSLITATHSYIFSLGLISLWLGESILKKGPSLFHVPLLIATAAIYFLLPAYEFGQREHLLLILLIPYFFYLIVSAQRVNFSRPVRYFISSLAGIGFCINIEFVILFFLLLIWQAWTLRSMKKIVCTENLIIFSIIVLYVASIWIFFSNYIFVLLPLIINLYVPTFDFSWSLLLLNTTFLTFGSTTILAIWHYPIFSLKKSTGKYYYQVFLLISIIFITQFLLTEKIWYYHMLPSLAIGILLFTLFLTINTQNILMAKQEQQDISFSCLLKIFFSYALLVLLPIKIAYANNQAAWQYFHNQKNTLHQMLQLLRSTTPNSPIYVFSTTVDPAATLAQYGGVQLGSRFAGLWMLPGILRLQQKNISSTFVMQAQKLLYHLVIGDFQHYQPQLVLIDNSRHKPYLQQPFDYLTYFKKDATFQAIWQHYRYLKTIGDYKIYTRTVTVIASGAKQSRQ